MSQTHVERSLVLPPRPDSPGAARRLLREVLDECARPNLRDTAELALTELATNAVLHAHTDLVVRVRCSDDELRVEVHDGSPVLVPLQRGAAEVASTGRGLALVAALCREHGVTTDGEAGKTVWFTLSDEPGPEPDLDDLLAAWTDDDVLPAVPPPSEHRTVPLVGFPAGLWRTAMRSHDDQLRELALLGESDQHPADDLAAADRARFAVRAALERSLTTAAGGGRLPAELPAAVDLELVVGPSSARDFALLRDLLDAAQRLTDAGRMLAPLAGPEVVAVRDWVVEEVVASLAGQRGRAWPGAASLTSSSGSAG